MDDEETALRRVPSTERGAEGRAANPKDSLLSGSFRNSYGSDVVPEREANVDLDDLIASPRFHRSHRETRDGSRIVFFFVHHSIPRRSSKLHTLPPSRTRRTSLGVERGYAATISLMLLLSHRTTTILVVERPTVGTYLGLPILEGFRRNSSYISASRVHTYIGIRFYVRTLEDADLNIIDDRDIRLLFILLFYFRSKSKRIFFKSFRSFVYYGHRSSLERSP